MKYHNYCSLLFYYATSVPLVQKIVSIYKLYKVSNTLKLTTQKLSNHNLTHLSKHSKTIQFIFISWTFPLYKAYLKPTRRAIPTRGIAISNKVPMGRRI